MVEYERFARNASTPDQRLDLAGLMRAEADELRPADPPRTVDVIASEIAAGWWASRRIGFVVARTGGEPVGYARWRTDVEDEPDDAGIHAFVLNSHRGQRIGANLAATALDDVTAAYARERINFWLRLDTDLGRQLADRAETNWGLSVKMVERFSRLDLSSVDRDRVAADLEERRHRTSPYEAVYFEMDDLPASVSLDGYCKLMEEVMNLMPVDELQISHETYTPERFMQGVAVERKLGRMLWHVVMVERATGRPVALTVISFNPSDTRAIDQWDTGVAADAQGNGLGKMVKLVMLEKVLEDLPDAWFIETQNARSNGPMIAINDALGFREHALGRGYQTSAAEMSRLLRGGA